jgi:hypothetical protein
MLVPHVILVGAVALWALMRWVRSRVVDTGLRDALDRGTVELVQEQLARAPLPVWCRPGADVRGHFLRLDTGAGACLRLRLYRQAAAGPAATRLINLSFSANRGWVAQLDGPAGGQHLLGWLVEVR